MKNVFISAEILDDNFSDYPTKTMTDTQSYYLLNG
jgi:hypothetical protein